FLHSDPDSMSHVPRSLVGDGELALKLLRRDAFLGRANQVDRIEPLSQSHVRVVKDSPDSHGVLIVARHALVQIPLFAGLAFGLKLRDAIAAASRTARTFRPADALKVSNAGFLGRKAGDNLKSGRLNLAGTLGPARLSRLSLSHRQRITRDYFFVK